MQRDNVSTHDIASLYVHLVNDFEDSIRKLYRRYLEEYKNRFYIVFEDEEGQDAGDLLNGNII